MVEICNSVIFCFLLWFIKYLRNVVIIKKIGQKYIYYVVYISFLPP